MTTIQPQVALHDSFFDAFYDLPKNVQKKVKDFINAFRKNPTAPGLNYEKINAADPKVRSLRIDQSYRAIVVKPERGFTFQLAWVANHDAAYAWARHRRFEVNPSIGTIQVYSVEEATQALAEQTRRRAERTPQRPAAPESSPSLFAPQTDETLLQAGVPAPLIASVRAVSDDDELDVLAPHLPKEAADVLYLLAAGETLEDALADVARRPPETPVDPEDFDAALENETSRQHVRVLDERDLEAMLEAPLNRWRVFLHPSQEKVVRMNGNGPIRVLGGAGTGKTVALLHRARHLAREVFPDAGQKLLVTTFTRNLAADLRRQLADLCGEEVARIETNNLHVWAVRWLRNKGRTYQIARADQARQIWREVWRDHPELDLPLGFFMQEWEQVVQAHDISERTRYMTFPRRGRGTRLDRKQRRAVWEVLQAYRSALDAQGLVEWADIVRMAREDLEAHPDERPYAAVLADEVQDFRASELKLLRLLAPEGPNTLFLTGDAHQRIYGHVARLSECGIQIQGRARRLKVNYRTTQSIRAHAVAVLKGQQVDDLDGNADTLKGYHSLRAGTDPIFGLESSVPAEEEFIEATLRHWLDVEKLAPEQICLCARSRKLLQTRYQLLIESMGKTAGLIETDTDDQSGPGIRLATMHRLKGLEYPAILIAGLAEDSFPQRIPPEYRSDPAAERDHAEQERRLLYVAMTRARDHLALASAGPIHPDLPLPPTP